MSEFSKIGRTLFLFLKSGMSQNDKSPRKADIQTFSVSKTQKTNKSLTSRPKIVQDTAAVHTKAIIKEQTDLVTVLFATIGQRTLNIFNIRPTKLNAIDVWNEPNRKVEIQTDSRKCWKYCWWMPTQIELTANKSQLKSLSMKLKIGNWRWHVSIQHKISIWEKSRTVNSSGRLTYFKFQRIYSEDVQRVFT